MFPALYALAMRMWLWLALTVVLGIASGGFFTLIAAIYLGFKGTEISWRTRPWQSVQHCLDTQHVWDGWGVTFVKIAVFLFVLFIVLSIIMAVKSS
jgi:membrane associated rhomboid family serine protease